MKFSVFQISRMGGREKNEDRMGYCYTRTSALFLLADGMGGHPEGEVAAQIAIQTIASLFQRQAQPELPNVAAFLNEAVIAAHRQILRYAMQRGSMDSPRTTVVVAVIQAGQLHWTHCGDSRFYLIRQGELVMRTKDHSLLEQHLIHNDVGDVGYTPNRNVLFTCLGSPTRPVFAVAGPLTLQQGDRAMLCSDGLWGTVPDAEIVYDLSNRPVDVAVPDLVEKALQRGGPHSDNVTCIAMEWEVPEGQNSAPTSISTDSINNGVFASTVQTGWPDLAAEVLDEAAIERSIAEINAAIRRSSIKKT
jgi:serine/threonine protein phosphatase PrpC